MDYMIVIAEHPVDLTIKVREYIRNGWTPQGGIAILQSSVMSSKQEYYQAMVKTK